MKYNIWKTYSVFISSTFADMQSERDYLAMVVFPQLNQELKKYSISLRIIDLRWGINTLDTDESDIEEKVMRVCFNEIERSRPFFIGLLGNRYGWIPDKYPKEFEVECNSEQSITSLEIMLGFFKNTNKNGCLFLERDDESYINMPKHIRCIYDDRYAEKDYSLKSYNRICELKKKIKQELSKIGKDNYYKKYHVKWEDNRFTCLEDFGLKVKSMLLEQILELDKSEDVTDPFQEIDCLQTEFVYLHNRIVVHRTKIINDIVEKIENKCGGLFLTGESGCGKSTIYSYLINYFQNKQSYIVLYHTTSIDSNNRLLIPLLKHWIYKLEDILCKEHKELIKKDECIIYFKSLLKIIPLSKKLLLFIDAANGFVSSEETDYLSFYPRNTFQNVFMFCTCTPEYVSKALKYHKCFERIEVSSFSYSDAKSMIDKYCNYYNKELYVQNIDKILSLHNGEHYCFQSPLWLSLCLQLLYYMNSQDFRKIKQCGSFDLQLIEYIDSLLTVIPTDVNELFQYFLNRISYIFGEFPNELIEIISIGYDGIPEETISYLMGEKWNQHKFAIVRNFIGNYIIEHGSEKKWFISHDKLKRIIKDKDMYVKISQYYLNKIANDEHVNDNILYYMYYSECVNDVYVYSEMFDYTEHNRFTDELIELLNVINIEAFMTFFLQIYRLSHNLFYNSIKVNRMKMQFEFIIKDLMFNGRYNEIVYLVRNFQRYIENCKLFYDFKIHIYITTDNYLFDSLQHIITKDKQVLEWEQALKRLKIKGIYSLFVVPICKKYYKWNIFKLKK